MNINIPLFPDIWKRRNLLDSIRGKPQIGKLEKSKIYVAYLSLLSKGDKEKKISLYYFLFWYRLFFDDMNLIILEDLLINSYEIIYEYYEIPIKFYKKLEGENL